MARKEKTSSAVEILHGRYVKDDPERKASLLAERINAEVAQLIHDLRKKAGLTQAELADLVGTTQSVISRLEDTDYDGHSLSMLGRIARALNQKLTVVMTAEAPEASEGKEVIVVKGEPLPPTPATGTTYESLDPAKSKSGRDK